jgi:hypothetical protein
VQALSSDVKAEDFRDPELGLAVRFGGWRKQYEDEYSNAYGGLAMVQGWEYWARQEMVGWEPSRVSRRPKGRIIAEPNSRRAVVIQIARLVPLVRLLAPLFPSQDGRYARRGFG